MRRHTSEEKGVPWTRIIGFPAPTIPWRTSWPSKLNAWGRVREGTFAFVIATASLSRLAGPRKPRAKEDKRASGRPIDGGARARIAGEEVAQPRGSGCEDEAPDRAS